MRKWRTANFLTWFTFSAGKNDVFSFVNLSPPPPIPLRATAQNLLNIKAFVPLFLFSTVYATGYNRILMFKEPVDGKILPGHVIKTEKVANEGSCRVKCFMEPNCVSITVGPADEHGGRMCELKNFTDESSSQSDLEERKGLIYYAVEVSERFSLAINLFINIKG